jgi:hypothetical protein
MDIESSAPMRARRNAWTDEQKQAAREREQHRRAKINTASDDDGPRVPSGFVAFPAWLLADHSISDLGKWVLLALSLYASKDGTCWPTAATLARTLNRSERTVFRGLQEVVALRLVTVIPRAPGGKQISSIYRLEFSRWGSITKPPPDKNDIPPLSKLTGEGCQNRHTEHDPKTGSSEHVDPPYPPTGGKTERAPRAAVGKKAGEPAERDARGPRPRMVALRDELLIRIRKSKTEAAANLVCPGLEPVLTEQEWRRLIPATVNESSLRAALELLPPAVFADAGVSITSALEYARGKRLELDSWHEAMEADVERAYEAGTLRSEWRAKLARAGM